MRKSKGFWFWGVCVFCFFFNFEILTRELSQRRLKRLAQGRTCGPAWGRAGCTLGLPRRQHSGSRPPPSRSRAPVPGTRPARSSCHLTLGRAPQSRSSWAAGRAGWGPPAAAPGLKRGGRPGAPRRLGGRGARTGGLAAPPPRLFRVRTAHSRPAPPAPPSPPGKRRPGGREPGPETPAPRSPALTAIVRPRHAQSVNLVCGGHGGQAQDAAEEAVRP